jgi:hypothetical protein
MVAMFRFAAVAVLFGVTLSSAPPAAEPIVITSGSVEVRRFGSFSFEPSPIQLTGTQGFSVDARGGDGFFGPALDCFSGCLAGDPVNLNASWLGSDLSGTLVFDGVSSPLGGVNQDRNVSINLMATTTIPLSAPSVVELTAPFLFQGIFWRGLLGTDPRMETVVGAGQVTTILERRVLLEREGYVPVLTVYQFEDAAVPEPGTLVLVGSAGVMALAGRLRRRRDD